MTGPRCWLSRGDDTRIRVDAHGVSLGRALGNDVVVRNPAASQLHALVHLGPTGPELLTFGRNGTRVNGTVVGPSTALQHGDTIEVPGESLVVHLDGIGPRDGLTRWGLARPDGTLYGLRRPIRVGGGVLDDLEVPGWPAGAVVCTPVQGALVLHLTVDARIGEEQVGPGELRLAKVGDEIEIAGATVRLYGEVPPCADQSTVLSPKATLPASASFTFLPTGAQLTLRFDHGDVTIRLSEVRARLVATLLGAGTEGRPGEWIVDEVVIPHVWPRQEGKTRVDVNILVHRLRRDLLKLGLNPFAVVEREERATRFLLAAGGTVRIE